MAPYNEPPLKFVAKIGHFALFVIILIELVIQLFASPFLLDYLISLIIFRNVFRSISNDGRIWI